MNDEPIQVDPEVNAWDTHFLEMAFHVAQMSKDPSTQTGAVIVRPNKSIISTGFNGFPQGMSDDPGLYADREVKYDRVVHCEMNALIFARQSVEGCTLYTTPFLSCSRCAVHMIQAGIQRFVAPMPSQDALSRWADAFERTKNYIREAGREFVLVDTSLDVWEYAEGMVPPKT